MSLLTPYAHTPPFAAALALEGTVQIVPVALLAIAYARRARALAGEERVPRWRQVCFYAGCLTIVGALLGLGEVGEQLLFAHMIALLLIGDIAALLLVLGLTMPLLAPLLQIGVFARLRVLANPLIAFPLWVIALYVWHVPTLYQAAVEHPGVHVLQHATFLASGVNLWMSLLGPLPAPGWFGNLGRLIYIAAMGLAMAGLGNIFLWSDVVFYPFYLDGDSARRVSPIADQNLAGAVLVVLASLSTIGLFGWLFVRSAREARERAALLEFARTYGLTLSHKRVARAVSAGRGAELRRRLEGRIEAGEGVSAPPATSDTML
jgi:putative membrane protein